MKFLTTVLLCLSSATFSDAFAPVQPRSWNTNSWVSSSQRLSSPLTVDDTPLQPPQAERNNKHDPTDPPAPASEDVAEKVAAAVAAAKTTDATETSTAVEVSSSGTLKPWQSKLTRVGMILYIMGMCLALPLTLLPQRLMFQFGFWDRLTMERNTVLTAAGCARWLMRLIPFCKIDSYASHAVNPTPSVWVCNHASLLDIFILLAADRQVRGANRRPVKIVYWKQLEDNPVCNLLFKQAGFIPVQMAANGNGNDNDYDKSSFRRLVKDSKQAFKDGFDIAIMPEGQPNPTPEEGLLEVYAGAFSLARMSRRPVQMMAMNGVHKLWHPLQGMICRERTVKIRSFPQPFYFPSGSDFVNTFELVVGHFALTGEDPPQPVLRELQQKYS